MIPPAPLYNLFTADTPQAKDFRANIVQYNAALAFTSLGVKVDRSVLGHGPPVFRIHGELRHLSGSLLPEETAPPFYSQLYIYDPHAAYQYRISQNKTLFSCSNTDTCAIYLSKCGQSVGASHLLFQLVSSSMGLFQP